MSEFSGRPQYDDPQSEEDEAVADSGTDLAYRRLAASSGEPGGDMAFFFLTCFPKRRRMWRLRGRPPGVALGAPNPRRVLHFREYY